MAEVVSSWEELLAAEDTDYATVEIGPDASVRLGSLSADDMMDWLKGQDDPARQPINGLFLVAKSLVNAAGERIGKLAEVARLREKQPKTVKKLVAAALELNGLNAKNVPSEAPTQTGVSHTD